MSTLTAVVRSVVVMGGTRVMLGCVVGLLVVCGALRCSVSGGGGAVFGGGAS